jgi:hypothetical protein
MKKSIRFIALTVSLSLVSGCATQPSNVAASHVSSLKYDSVDCRRLGIESADVEAKLSSVTSSLQSKANTDAVLIGASLILWPLLFGTMATGGKAEEQELARLKGEKIAIEQASLVKNCGGTIKDSNASPLKPETQPAISGPQTN